MNKYPLHLKGLIDSRNESLWNELNSFYSINVITENNRTEYGCYSKGKISTIYVPLNNKNPAFFTHELLHLLIRKKDVFIGAALQRGLVASSSLKRIYSLKLIEHIGNCLDHIKMLPIYLELGYNKNLFLSDFQIDKCPEKDLINIERNFKSWWIYNGSAIDAFIGKHFAIKACPNAQINYRPKLERLKKINQELFTINQNIFDNWGKVDINEQDILAFNYNDVAIAYQDAMENWVRGKQIL